MACLRKIYGFLRGRSGVAATEFALIAPLLMGSWLAMAQLMQLSMASAKSSMAAQSVADMVARYSGGWTDTFSDMEAAAAAIVAPLPTNSNNPSISVVYSTLGSSGAPTLTWSCSSGTNAPTSAQITTSLGSAPALTTSNSSLGYMVMVMVVYSYTPTVIGGILSGQQTYTAAAYATPRLNSAIPKPC